MGLPSASSDKSQMTKGRAFSTKYEDHKQLLRKFALKATRRMMELRCCSMTFDDIYQEMSLSYVKAANMWNPDNGVSFSAYMGATVWNQFNKVAERAFREELGLGLVFLEDQATLEEGNDVLEGIDLSLEIESCCAPDVAMMRNEEIRNTLASLSPESKLVIRELMNPSEALKATYKAMKDHSEVAKKVGKRVLVPKDINLRVIAKHYQFSPATSRKVREELRETYGVDV